MRVQSWTSAALSNLTEHRQSSPRDRSPSPQAYRQRLRDQTPRPRGRASSPRDFDLAAGAADYSPRGLLPSLKSNATGRSSSPAWRTGQRFGVRDAAPDSVDIPGALRGSLPYPHDPVRFGLFSTWNLLSAPRASVSSAPGSLRWFDSPSSSSWPITSRHRHVSPESKSSSRHSADRNRHKATSPQPASSPTRSAQPSHHRHKPASLKPGSSSRPSAEQKRDRPVSPQPDASSRRSTEQAKPAARHPSSVHVTAPPSPPSPLPPPPPLPAPPQPQPEVKAVKSHQGARCTSPPRQSLLSDAKEASHKLATIGVTRLGEQRAVPSQLRAASPPAAVAQSEGAKDRRSQDRRAEDRRSEARRSEARTKHKDGSLSRCADEAKPVKPQVESAGLCSNRKPKRSRISDAKTVGRSHAVKTSADVNQAETKSTPVIATFALVLPSSPSIAAHAAPSPGRPAAVASPANVSATALPAGTSDAAGIAPPPGVAAAGCSELLIAPSTAACSAPPAGHSAATGTEPPSGTSATAAVAPPSAASSAPQLVGVPTDPRRRPAAVKSLFGPQPGAALEVVPSNQVKADRMPEGCGMLPDPDNAGCGSDTSQHTLFAKHTDSLHPLQPAQHSTHSPAALTLLAVATAAQAPAEPLQSTVHVLNPSHSTHIITPQPERLPQTRPDQAGLHASIPAAHATAAAIGSSSADSLLRGVVAAHEPAMDVNAEEQKWAEAIRTSGALTLETKGWYYQDPKVSCSPIDTLTLAVCLQ